MCTYFSAETEDRVIDTRGNPQPVLTARRPGCLLTRICVPWSFYLARIRSVRFSWTKKAKPRRRGKRALLAPLRAVERADLALAKAGGRTDAAASLPNEPLRRFTC